MGDYTTPRRTAVWDLETYRDYFLCMFKNVKTKKPVGFEMYGSQKLDVSSIKDIFREFRIVSFNGNNYDIPMILLAWQGATCMELKEASDRIIQERMRPWEFLKEYGLTMPEWIDHIDLFEPAPSPMVGLKKYGGRMHSKRLQDLPYHHDDLIIERGSDEKRLTVFNYCVNDLDTTIDLYHAISGELKMRENLSDRHGIDLRSKSDAQIAEAIIKKEVSRKLGKPIYRDRDKRPGGVFTYKAPDFIEFETNALQDLLWEIEKGAFRVNANTGKVELPQFLADRVITLDATHFKMGIGGLHSMEQRAIHVADEDTILVDFDVTSYYPSLILLCNLFPETLGPNFIPVYRNILTERVEAKRKMQALEVEIAEVERQIAEIEGGVDGE